MGIKEDFEKWFADRFKGALDFDEEAEDGDAVAAISRIVGLEAFEAGQVALAGHIAELEAERDALRRIAWLIGSIFVHGNFVAETANERELELLLREQGTFWETLSEFDAAIAAKEPNRE